MHILLAEDDIDTAVFVQRGLIQLGHVVTQVTNGEDALRLAAKDGFEAIVLDRMMPGMEGLDVLRQLRAASISVPVIVLTAKGGISDRVSGLDAGADDYLVKPFAMAELVARLNAVTRRSPMPEVSTRLEVGDVVLDAMRRSVTRAGRVIHLQPRE